MSFTVRANGPYTSLFCHFVQLAFPQRLENTHPDIVDVLTVHDDQDQLVEVRADYLC